MSVVFFFKQKTAYEMRISDWSSDVCSSDLRLDRLLGLQGQQLIHGLHRLQRTFGRLALANEIGQHAFVFAQVLRHLGLHLHSGLQAVERVPPTLLRVAVHLVAADGGGSSEEHTSELQSLMRISYAVFCLTKPKTHPALHYLQSI